MNVMGAIKGNTLEVNWSIQRFMEEIKIILADIYIYIYIFFGFCFQKAFGHNFKVVNYD